MSGKMTNEEWTTFQGIASGDDLSWDDRWRGWMGKAAAHIAALTAERDAYARVAGDATPLCETLGAEVLALRERVKALEAESKARLALATTWKAQAEKNESCLAAIRKRAGDVDALWDAFRDGKTEADGVGNVARYIVGDDAEPCPCGARDGERHRALQPETPEPAAAETPLCECSRPKEHAPETDCYPSGVCGPHPVVGGWGVVCVLPTGHEGGHSDGTDTDDVAPHPEPTTAEAFATVRGWIDVYAASGLRVDGVKPTLSLLERRMGAQEAALRMVLKIAGEGSMLTQGERETIRSALADAPPVFTLEEVQTAMERTAIHAPAQRDVVAALTAMRGMP